MDVSLARLNTARYCQVRNWFLTFDCR